MTVLDLFIIFIDARRRSRPSERSRSRRDVVPFARFRRVSILTTHSTVIVPQTRAPRVAPHAHPPPYPWQLECLSRVARTSRSLVYTAPTGAGKSRVADALLEETLASDGGGRALVVLPYVALVRERATALAKTLRARGIGVRAYAGGESEGWALGGDARCAVTTIEKAANAVSRALERGSFDELRIVVVDELHMVSEDERGGVLEGMLARIRHATRSGRARRGGPRIVCMSATVNARSLERLAKWLDAETYVGTYRPVELREHVVREDGVFVKTGEGLTRVRDAPRAGGSERERELGVVAELVGEVFVHGHSTLVFCASKAQCSNVAKRLAGIFHRHPAAMSLRERFVERLFDACEGAPDVDLVQAILSGIAWHHAGLTTAEKNVIEEGFRDGAILALTCTTTLAAGVNLPTRRTIIIPGYIAGTRTPSMAQYKQMAGRAGRKGQSDVGESFLIVMKKDAVTWAQNLVCGDLPPLESRLFPPSRGRDAPPTAEQKKFYLESIACGILKTKEDAGELACRTFAWTSEDDYSSILLRQEVSLKQIHDEGIVMVRRTGENSTEWCSTPEGFAFYRCSLPIAHAKKLRSELDDALRNGLNLTSRTHLLFFCISNESNFLANNLNWHVWSDWLEHDNVLHQLGEKHLGVTREYAEHAQYRLGVSAESRAVRSRHERLAAAQLLSELLANDDTIFGIEQKWSLMSNGAIDRGKIQSLQNMAATTAGMASVLANECGWSALAGLMLNVSEELQAGARRELLPLMRLDGMTGARARSLYNAGFKTPTIIASLATEKLDKLVEACLKSLSRSSRAGLDQAMRTTAWRVATSLAKNAREVSVMEARAALANLEE